MSVRLAAAQKSFILFLPVFFLLLGPRSRRMKGAQAGNQPVRGRRKAANKGIIVKTVLHNIVLPIL